MDKNPAVSRGFFLWVTFASCSMISLHSLHSSGYSSGSDYNICSYAEEQAGLFTCTAVEDFVILGRVMRLARLTAVFSTWDKESRGSVKDKS